MKRWTMVALLLGAMVVTFSSFVYLSGTYELQGPSQFTVNGKTFAITYLAATQAEREAGLMNRTITGGTTMLFIFPKLGTYPFWMYNTRSNLDIIWLETNKGSGTVVYMVKDVPGCYNRDSCAIYYPAAEANYVLEVQTGFVDSNDIMVGTAIMFH